MAEFKHEDFKLVTVNDAHLLVSAVKKAEKEDALVVRLYNASAEPVEGAVISLGVPVQGGYVVNSLERGDEELEAARQRVCSAGGALVFGGDVEVSGIGASTMPEIENTNHRAPLHRAR